MGKSTLGRAIANRLGYDSLTVDDLLTAARAVTNEETHPALHAIGRQGHLAYFTEEPKDLLVSDAQRQERAVWPMIELVIRSRVVKASPIVIDWWLLSPSTVTGLEVPGVRSIWLHLEPEALWARERRNMKWTEGSSDAEKMLENFMHRSLWRNSLVAAEAERCDLPVLYLRGDEPAEVVTDRAIEMLALAAS